MASMQPSTKIRISLPERRSPTEDLDPPEIHEWQENQHLIASDYRRTNGKPIEFMGSLNTRDQLRYAVVVGEAAEPGLIYVLWNPTPVEMPYVSCISHNQQNENSILSVKLKFTNETRNVKWHPLITRYISMYASSQISYESAVEIFGCSRGSERKIMVRQPEKKRLRRKATRHVATTFDTEGQGLKT